MINELFATPQWYYLPYLIHHRIVNQYRRLKWIHVSSTQRIFFGFTDRQNGIASCMQNQR